MAQNGVNLVLNARGEELLEEVAVAVREKGVRALTVVGDASLATNARKMVEAAVSIGEFAGFIHNAGVLHPGPFLHEPPEAMFENVWRTNVLAAYQIAHFSYPELRRNKSGLAVFFGSGAAEMNVQGIAYRPGAVETDMQKGAREAKGSGAEVLHRFFGDMQKQGTLITPETAARALVQIIRRDPRRFHGKIATYKDGM